MEQLSNKFQLLQWNFRRLLNIPQKTVSPVVWRPPMITSSHEPSSEFRENLSEEENKRIDRILEELFLFSRLSVRFPKKISDSEWKTFLELKSRKSRFDEAMFLFRKEKLEEEDARKKLEKVNFRKISEQNVGSRVPSYMLHFPNSVSEEYYQMKRLYEAYLLENRPILAVDCQFLSRLSPRGRGLTALQLQYLITENRRNPDPFRLHFVNYDSKNSSIQDLEKSKLQSIRKSHVFNPIVTENGLETYENHSKNVIYLSPDATEELESVDDDKIYVIGGIVDRVPEPGIPKHASLEASQSAGVFARKLPIDRYVDFKSGSKFLTLLAVAEILRQVNIHGDWKKAMKVAIPVRNTRGADEKNPKARAAQLRIHAFNQEILKRIDRRLGKDFI
ncbi:RNA (guanine-9-)-methyltransferase domain-containing protein 1 [Caenorhabditis elegans]|uniref:RNA (guanine-9-)-methyltransferase domain-containing protein 1 n=1 Tax=Caenorhabditis elegans TaxID=6239 RepID=Q9BI62_CAEEL|nr:RNA (guanine-9-)-methyltransferase domain-containing protein 1 [Caenorhabditis elegans]CCD71333.1 RNA (guanine-9-)-methyltransferase domain-containing protein 1 [Caenorhabditis elegans]|eukprot:NP_491647.3 Uncharacterized protein CELE_F46F11.10 [Caenorhabditis elegans]